MNELLFIIHTIIVAGSALVALKLGKEALVGFICLLSILSNLFITKQIALFGCNVTGGEVFAVGAIFGLNVLQEFYGREIVQKTVRINFFMLFFYLAMSQLHLWYLPNQYDTMHPHFSNILAIMPRITLASITVYFVVQTFDAYFYHGLKTLCSGRYLLVRTATALICSQLLDTIFFTYLGLYGIIADPWHVIMVSMVIKLAAIAGATPFMLLAKKLVPHRNPHE